MKRFVLLLPPLLALGGFVLADAPPTRPADRVAQLRRDLKLVEKLVNEGLKLANEDQPLERVAICNRLADGFAREMERAVNDRDGARAALLGKNLQALLKRGVAANLNLARDSARKGEVERAGEQTLLVIQPLQDQLDHPSVLKQENMETALQTLSAGRSEVEKAYKRSTLKVPPVGKKPGGKN